MVSKNLLYRHRMRQTNISWRQSCGSSIPSFWYSEVLLLIFVALWTHHSPLSPCHWISKLMWCQQIRFVGILWSDLNICGKQSCNWIVLFFSAQLFLSFKFFALYFIIHHRALAAVSVGSCGVKQFGLSVLNEANKY